ncbi:MAG: thrombospondin type 3 repeat-containing protein [Deltaproteobacteria bacterium]|nr:thrombospondin type 3 repeat-containing protein [Deltaproteobacteria bacterium]
MEDLRPQYYDSTPYRWLAFKLGRIDVDFVPIPQDPHAYPSFLCGCDEGNNHKLLMYPENKIAIKEKFYECRDMDARCDEEPEEGIETGYISTSYENTGDLHLAIDYNQPHVVDTILNGQCSSGAAPGTCEVREGCAAPLEPSPPWLATQFADSNQDGLITTNFGGLCRARVVKTVEIYEGYEEYGLSAEDLQRRMADCLSQEIIYQAGLDLGNLEHPELAINPGDPWPEVTECAKQVIRNVLAQWTQADSDGDRVCNNVDFCDQTPDFDDYRNYDDLEASDGDRDFVGPACDNCLEEFNPNQEDSDHDNIGDVCDLCPGLSPINDALHVFLDSQQFANTQTTDRDGDNIGDACDLFPADQHNDCDGDGLPAVAVSGGGEIPDRFPFDYDNDTDGDEIQDCTAGTRCFTEHIIQNPSHTCDSCPNASNSGQDNDHDGIDNACDPDLDGDGINDKPPYNRPDGRRDNCPEVSNRNQRDTDSDGEGDACDDRDYDTVVDISDNCPDHPNRFQNDQDGDDQGDVCDSCPRTHASNDRDNDCIANNQDHCPNHPDETNSDADEDGKGDVCDNCPDNNNPNQEDNNHDGIGDACQALLAPPLTVSFAQEPRYISQNQLNGNGTIEVGRVLISGATPGQRMRLNFAIHSNGRRIYEGVVPAVFGGNVSIPWRGLVNESPAPAGAYQVVSTLTVLNQAGDDKELAPISHDFTVFKITFTQPQNAAGSPLNALSMYVNNDNDDLAQGDHQPDWMQEGRALNDNDLAELRVSVEPNIPNASVSLEAVNYRQNPNPPHVNFKAWKFSGGGVLEEIPFGLNRNYSLPMPVHLEGIQAITSPQQAQSPIKLIATLCLRTPAGGCTPLASAHQELSINLIQVDVVKDRDNNTPTVCDPDYRNGPIERIDETNPPVDFLHIALWSSAYDEENNVYNSLIFNPTCDFITRDPDRFYLRVINPRANLNEQVNIISFARNVAKIGTVHDSDGSIFDNLTPLTLVETGPNTGIFLSKPQMLTTYDLDYLIHDRDFSPYVMWEEDLQLCATTYRCNDDNFKAHDAFANRVVDDAPNDRTHQASIEDSLQFVYQQDSPPLPPLALTVPVCQRTPSDERRELHMRVFVFNEPFIDSGIITRSPNGQSVRIGEGDGQFTFVDRDNSRHCNCPDDIIVNGICDVEEEECEPFENVYNDLPIGQGGFVQPDPITLQREGIRGPILPEVYVHEMVRRADRLWQQACISVFMDELYFIDAPKIDGVDFFAYRQLLELQDVNRLLEHFSDGSTNILDLFIFPRRGNGFSGRAHFASGFATHGRIPGRSSEFSTILVGVTEFNGGVLAHEIGHVLENYLHVALVDQCDPGTIGCPQSNDSYFYPKGFARDSRYVNDARRLPPSVVERARKRRHEHNLMEHGNRLLCLYDPNRRNNRQCLPPPEEP